GRSCDSSVGFTLPNGAVRSPDASWISNERLESISRDEIRRFPHVFPEFVIELLSPSDSLPALKRKMREWIENGAELGWLIDPFERILYEYTPKRRFADSIRRTRWPERGPVDGFRLDLRNIWKRK